MHCCSGTHSGAGKRCWAIRLINVSIEWMECKKKKKIPPESQCWNDLAKQWITDFDINWGRLLISTLKLSLILTTTYQNTNGHWIRSKDNKIIKKSVGSYTINCYDTWGRKGKCKRQVIRVYNVMSCYERYVLLKLGHQISKF